MTSRKLTAWLVTVCLAACVVVSGCAGLSEKKQREAERAAMRAAMTKAHTAQTESVRRKDSGQLIPDWPRLIATLEGIDVAGCPVDFRVAWDDVIDGFKKESRRSPAGRPVLKTALGLWALAASQNWPAALAALSELSGDAVSGNGSELQGRMERLIRVCERHSLKRLDAGPAGR